MFKPIIGARLIRDAFPRQNEVGKNPTVNLNIKNQAEQGKASVKIRVEV